MGGPGEVIPGARVPSLALEGCAFFLARRICWPKGAVLGLSPLVAAEAHELLLSLVGVRANGTKKSHPHSICTTYAARAGFYNSAVPPCFVIFVPKTGTKKDLFADSDSTDRWTTTASLWLRRLPSYHLCNSHPFTSVKIWPQPCCHAPRRTAGTKFGFCYLQRTIAKSSTTKLVVNSDRLIFL